MSKANPFSLGPRGLLLATLAIVGIIGFIDYCLGYFLSMSVFYVIPVVVASWRIGRAAAILVSATSAGAAYLADELTRPAFVPSFDPVWKAIASLAIFLLIAWLVDARKQDAQRREELMAQLRERTLIEERNRMAGEIHDTLAQGFTGISIQLEAAADVLNSIPEASLEHINQAKKLAHESLDEARRSVWALQPPKSEQLGIVASVANFVERVAAGQSVGIESSIQGTPQPMSLDTETELLRICQEATVNALRHAHPRRIQIQLIYQPSTFELRVLDNGRGFDPDARKNGLGYGLISMRNRAERIGAILTLTSKPEMGTRIVVSVPASVHSPEGPPGETL